MNFFPFFFHFFIIFSSQKKFLQKFFFEKKKRRRRKRGSNFYNIKVFLNTTKSLKCVFRDDVNDERYIHIYIH